MFNKKAKLFFIFKQEEQLYGYVILIEKGRSQIIF